MDNPKIVESVKFLLVSVSKLSDRFLDASESSRRSFEQVGKDIDDLIERLGRIEADLVNWRDQQLLAEPASIRSTDLPIKAGQEKLLIPPLNLPLESILDTYRQSPALLQPFARPCSVSGRTLSGQIVEVELEAFSQGTSWMIETQDGDWLLLPRPGLLSRRSQVQSLVRLFEIDAEPELPAELELLEPGRADVVEYGRRWMLVHKGRLGLQPDPLKNSLETRLLRLESRLQSLEQHVD